VSFCTLQDFSCSHNIFAALHSLFLRYIGSEKAKPADATPYWGLTTSILDAIKRCDDLVILEIELGWVFGMKLLAPFLQDNPEFAGRLEQLHLGLRKIPRGTGATKIDALLQAIPDQLAALGFGFRESYPPPNTIIRVLVAIMGHLVSLSLGVRCPMLGIQAASLRNFYNDCGSSTLLSSFYE
jgi:hypothetical protein